MQSKHVYYRVNTIVFLSPQNTIFIFIDFFGNKNNTFYL